MPKQRFFAYTLATALSILFTQLALSQDVTSDTQTTWEAVAEETIFPAVIVSTASISSKRPAANSVLGDSRSVARILIKPSVANARVHVEVRVDGLSEDSSYDATLGAAGQQYAIAPTIRFDMRKLLSLEQPFPTTVMFSVKVNGSDLGQKTKQVQFRAITDVPFAVTDSKGHVQDLSPLFAAFVNENSLVIEQILQEALRWKAVESFDGYQSHSPNAVQMQVFAIWNVLQRHHVKYSSITTASGFSDKVQSQSVRFVDDSLRMNQANCVDGSVLFASVLYKIGLYPVLVKLPGHMFVGYYTDESSYGHPNPPQNILFLETTLLGAAGWHQPSAYNIAFHPLIHPAQSSESWNQFVQAVNYANREFQEKVLPGLSRHEPGYIVIDVRRARQAGISPIAH
jgi:hypothetical protein